MIYKIIPLKIGIISLPVFVYWAFQWIILMSDFDENLKSFFYETDIYPMITFVIALPLILLGLSTYISIRLWLKLKWIK